MSAFFVKKWPLKTTEGFDEKTLTTTLDPNLCCSEFKFINRIFSSNETVISDQGLEASHISTKRYFRYIGCKELAI